MPLHYPGLPPYLDDAFARRGVSPEFAAEFKKSPLAKQAGKAIGLLDQIAADPGDQSKALADVVDRVARMIETQVAGAEALTVALLERVSVLGIDPSRLDDLHQRPATSIGPGDVSSAVADAKGEAEKHKADAEAARRQAEKAAEDADRARGEASGLQGQLVSLRTLANDAQEEVNRQAEGRDRAIAEAVKRSQEAAGRDLEQAEKDRDAAVKLATEAEARAKAAEEQLAALRAEQAKAEKTETPKQPAKPDLKGHEGLDLKAQPTDRIGKRQADGPK